MALNSHLFSELVKIMKPGMNLASMGYPDIIATPEEVEAVAGKKLMFLDESVRRWHGVAHGVTDAQEFFNVLGVGFDVYDVAKIRGCEIICDLNHPFKITQEYDIVLDVGTLEHCFNIGQALMNMASFVKEGGYILHTNPFQMGNHGFYGLNPTLFADFYETNGFELVSCVLIEKDSKEVHEVSKTSRFVVNGGECNLFTIARRASIKEFRFPIQTKYKKFIKENK